MFSQYYFYFLLQFIVISNEFCKGDPIRGKNVQLAEKGEFPFVVSLSKTSNFVTKEKHFCGGALISKKHVLTSAHCIYTDDCKSITVVAGSLDFKSGQLYNVQRCTTYVKWALENNIIPEEVINDIAIITLTLNVKYIVPVTISKLKKEEVINQTVVTVGWGMINKSRCSGADSLRKAYCRVLTPQEFYDNGRALFGYPLSLPPNLYATGAEPPVVVDCGDSGSPLLLASDNELVGISDSSCKIENPEENPHAQSLHVVVDYYRDFIESVINGETK